MRGCKVRVEHQDVTAVIMADQQTNHEMGSGDVLPCTGVASRPVMPSPN
ncbi:hypothetical protein MHO82_24495 [Vibrio sp. Of7-15]|nr:hypothetical protein [Vibrio sp. Of7-15]MCG7500027.1 hypothetical protein [Vibrio sp. Of7-15]